VQSNGNGAVSVPPPAAAPAAIAAAAAAGTTVAELRGTTTPFSAMEKSVAKNMQASLAVAEFRATVRTCYSFFELSERLIKAQPEFITNSILHVKVLVDSVIMTWSSFEIR
jgi:predicted flavoprotein YhiN